MGEDAAIGMIAGGGVGSAYGSYEAGQTNKSLDRWNAKVSDLQAKDAIERGAVASERLHAGTMATVGAQNAGFAGQGVVVGKGSSADVTDSTTAIGALDQARIKHNAQLEAWGYQVRGANSRFQGDIAAAEGDNQAISTLITTGGRAADQRWRSSLDSTPASTGLSGGIY